MPQTSGTWWSYNPSGQVFYAPNRDEAGPYDSQRTEEERYGSLPSWTLSGTGKSIDIGGIEQNIELGQFGQPNFWLQIIIVIVGGLALWFITRK